MALSAVLYDSISSSTDGTSYSGASLTPTSGKLYLAFINTRKSADTTGGGDPSSVTIGNAAAMTLIGTAHNWFTGANGSKMWLYGRKADGTEGTGAANVTFPATVMGAEMLIAEVGGHDTGATLAQLIVQLVKSTADPGAATSGSVTLAAAGNSNNRPMACFTHIANEATTPGTNWTELADVNHAAPTTGTELEWRSDAFDTTAAASWTTSAQWGCIAVEIKAATGGTQFNQTLAVTSTMTPAFTRLTSTVKAIAATLTSVIAKRATRLLEITSPMTAAIASVKVFLKLLEVTSSMVTTLARLPRKSLAVAGSMAVVFVKRVAKTVALGSSLAPAIVKRSTHALSVSTTMTAALTKRTIHALAAGASMAVTLLGELAGTVFNQTLAVTPSFVAVIAGVFEKARHYEWFSVGGGSMFGTKNRQRKGGESEGRGRTWR